MVMHTCVQMSAVQESQRMGNNFRRHQHWRTFAASMPSQKLTGFEPGANSYSTGAGGGRGRRSRSVRFDLRKCPQYPRTVAQTSATRQRPGFPGPRRFGRELGKAAVRSSGTRRRSDDGNGQKTRRTTVAKGKRTFQPNNRRRARVHGFRLRMRTRAGRAIVAGRRRKGRQSLTA